jgi:hypothetical protein
VNEGTSQVEAWKDHDARDTDSDDHPAGGISLPKRMTAAVRAAALGGYAIGIGGAATFVVPTLSDTCTG